MQTGPVDAINLAHIRRVLVVKLRHHGDVLLTSPVFSALKHCVPDAEIDALVYAETTPMLSENPSVAGIFTIDQQWKRWSKYRRVAAEWRLLSALRSRRYDLLIHLSEHPRGAWLARVLGCAFSVAPNYSQRSAFWRNSFTHLFSLPKNPRRHMVEWNLDSLRRIGIQPAESQRQLLIVPGKEGDAEAATLLETIGVGQAQFIHIHPSSRWPFKCWPESRNAALIDALQRQGERVVLTSGPAGGEMEQVARIMALCQTRPLSLAGRLSLKGLAALAGRAKLFIGVDSAPMHIASAMGTPVIALFGPSGELEWGPWSKLSRVVASASHSCRPCGIDGCGGGKISDCLVNLDEKKVLEAVQALLAK